MKRRALFVGVDEYDDPQIRNLRFSRIDAHSLNDLFADVGYDVKYLPNPTKAEVLAAVRERTAGLAAGDSFFFYFAGHGFTQGGRDLLFCRDDVYADLRFDDAGLKFDKLRQRTETGAGYDRVFVLDACRSDFLTGTRGDTTYARDLAPASNLVKDAPKTGTLAVLRSCSPYQYALEIESRQHGLFTCAFIDVMRAARREGTRLAFDESFGDAVAKTMTAIARNAHLTAEQTPDFAKSAGCAAQVLIEGLARQPPLPAAAPVYVVCPECGKYNLPTDTFRCKVCGRDHLCIKHFSETRSSCTACDAKRKQEIIENTAHHIANTVKRWVTPPKPLVASVTHDPHPGEEMTIALPGGVPMTFCWCPATTSEDWKRISDGKSYFLMGGSDPWSWVGLLGKLGKLHRVTLTKGFWMGRHEVTQRQWESVMDCNPSHFKGRNLPVEKVSWNDCQTFIRAINADGRFFASLPTEAQWEYACRAGTTTPFCFGDALTSAQANCEINGFQSKATSVVGSYAPNAWGLYDMHGNVWEWCSDWYGEYVENAIDPTGPESGTGRVARGGCWNLEASNCHSAGRNKFGAVDRRYNLGFRLACSAELR